MILSASRRTDIPCYYSEWFMNRLKEGCVLTRNPMNHAQLSSINISPELIDCIVFWTKDAKNTIPYLESIDKMGYNYYFQFTITPYDKKIEKNLRNKEDIVNTFIELSNLIGKERVLWRYDPIILNDSLFTEYHKNEFLELCEKLHPYTQSVTISFVDMYLKLKTQLVREITNNEIDYICDFIGQTAKKYGLSAKACCEKAELSAYGIEKASCIDKALIEKICAYTISASADKNQRSACGCCESIDIGAYNTCLNGCVYCYANNSPSSSERRHNLHNPKSKLLVGDVLDGEKVSERKVKSFKQTQTKIF